MQQLSAHYAPVREVTPSGDTPNIFPRDAVAFRVPDWKKKNIWKQNMLPDSQVLIPEFPCCRSCETRQQQSKILRFYLQHFASVENQQSCFHQVGSPDTRASLNKKAKLLYNESSRKKSEDHLEQKHESSEEPQP